MAAPIPPPSITGGDATAQSRSQQGAFSTGAFNVGQPDALSQALPLVIIAGVIVFIVRELR